MRSNIGKSFALLHLCLIGATVWGCAPGQEAHDDGQNGGGQNGGGQGGSFTGLGGAEQGAMGGRPGGGGSGATMGAGGSAQNASARVQFVLREVH